MYCHSHKDHIQFMGWSIPYNSPYMAGILTRDFIRRDRSPWWVPLWHLCASKWQLQPPLPWFAEASKPQSYSWCTHQSEPLNPLLKYSPIFTLFCEMVEDSPSIYNVSCTVHSKFTSGSYMVGICSMKIYQYTWKVNFKWRETFFSKARIVMTEKPQFLK